MGGSEHKCCATTVNHASPKAATVHKVFQQDLAVTVVQRVNQTEVTLHSNATVSVVAISPSPPGITTVLRT